MDGTDDKRIFICTSDISTSADRMAAGSVSLRVMLSEDAVMPVEKKKARMDDITKMALLYFNSHRSC